MLLVACGSDRAGSGDPCEVATSMRYEVLRQLPSEVSCQADDDCVVIATGVDCANVHLGDCGTLINRAGERSLDWPRTERRICEAVEGTDFGCSVYASCSALGPPRCEQGVCVQEPLTAAP